MPSPAGLAKWDAPLPSHLLFCQAADLLGVTDAAISNRVSRGTLAGVEILGRTMVPTAALAEQHPHAWRFPIAFPPSEALEVLARAQRAILDGEGEKMAFSAFDLAGIHLALTWPSLGATP